MSTKDINQERICVQQILPKHLNELNSYDHPSISKEHRKRLQAAFFTKKLWPQNTKITIGFFITPVINVVQSILLLDMTAMKKRNYYKNN